MIIKDDAINLLALYDRLREWVLEIISDVPYRAYVDNGDYIHIAIEGDEVVVKWKEYESDYYGSGDENEREARFPVEALSYSKVRLDMFREKIKAEDREREQKVRLANAAVERDRKEARDRAEYERLKRKYEDA